VRPSSISSITVPSPRRSCVTRAPIVDRAALFTECCSASSCCSRRFMKATLASERTTQYGLSGTIAARSTCGWVGWIGVWVGLKQKAACKMD
tara:strand:- start:494 stop:769 length:276 start_codon:yes stop_codon:yes gene_type:complete